MLQSYVLESDKGHDLGQLSSRHLGLATIAYEDPCGKAPSRSVSTRSMSNAPPTYCRRGRRRHLRVHATLPAFRPRRGASASTANWKCRRAGHLAMERNGVLIDAAALARQSHELAQKIMALEAQAYELARPAFNLARPSNSAKSSSNAKGLPVKKRPFGTPSTDEEVLSDWRSTTPCPNCCWNTAACPS